MRDDFDGKGRLNDMKKEYFYTAIAVIAWGTTATISKGLLSDLDTMFTLAVSFSLASIVLLIQNCVTKKIKLVKKISTKTKFQMLVVGAMGVFIYNILLLKGTWLLPAQEAFVINYLWPAFLIIFSAFLLKEKMNLGKIVAVISSFIGVVIVATGGDLLGFQVGSITGVFYCVTAAVSYALYSAINKKMQYDGDLIVLFAYVTGAVISILWVSATNGFVMPSTNQWLGLILYGVLCNALPYVLWVNAMARGNTAIIANLAYLTPVISLFFTHFFLDEDITIYSVLGLGLILLGILVQMVANRSNLS